MRWPFRHKSRLTQLHTQTEGNWRIYWDSPLYVSYGDKTWRIETPTEANANVTFVLVS